MFYVKISEIFSFALFLALVLSCSSKKTEAPGPIQSAMNQKVNWQSSCLDSDRFGLTMDSRYQIDSGNFQKTNRYYSDGTCSDLAVESQEVGTLTIAPTSDSTGSVDFKYQSVTVSPKNSAGVLALNAVSYCGSNNWQLNDSIEVTNLSGGEACWDRTPREVHDIYLVNEQNLFFGAGTEQDKSGGTRPTALDQSRPWKIE